MIKSQLRMIIGRTKSQDFIFNPTFGVTQQIFKRQTGELPEFIIGSYGVGKTASLILQCLLSGYLNKLYYLANKMKKENLTQKEE